MHLRLPIRRLRIVFRAKVQLLVCRVVHLAHFLGHDIPEHKVRGGQYLLPGAEVSAQDHAPGLAVRRLRRIRVAPVFLQEYGGIRQTEPIDALLHVSHGEQVPTLSGDGLKDAVLHLVGILILIHHDLLIPLGYLPCQLRRASVLLTQQRDGIVLLIGEIHGVAPHLLRLIPLGKLLRQPQQRQHRRGCGVEVLQMLLLRHLIRRRQLFQGILALLQHRLRRRLCRTVLIAPHRAHAPEFRHDAAHGLPALLCRLFILPQLCSCLQKTVGVGVVHRLAVLHGVHGPLQLLCPEQRLSHGILHDRPTIYAVGQSRRQVPPALRRLMQPPHRVGVALDLLVQLQHQLHQLPVIPPRAQRTRQQRKLRITAFNILIERFQRPLQCPILQKLGLRLIQYPEVRRQASSVHRLQKMDMLPQQRRAEGVHRLDIRLIHTEHLTAQMPILR